MLGGGGGLQVAIRTPTPTPSPKHSKKTGSQGLLLACQENPLLLGPPAERVFHLRCTAPLGNTKAGRLPGLLERRL